MRQIEPTWLTEARRFVGLKEVVGAAHEPEILQMWRDIKRGGIKDDETPWCAAFVGAMLERSGVRSSRFESARSYLEWGQPLSEPEAGCIVVFERQGGGHVGFVVGRTADGHLLVLGGNQSNRVSIAPFDRARVIAYRWPPDVPPPPAAPLMVLGDQGEPLSNNEA